MDRSTSTPERLEGTGAPGVEDAAAAPATGPDDWAERLVERMGPAGHWRGRLSSSALSTATVVTALELARRAVADGVGTDSPRPGGETDPSPPDATSLSAPTAGAPVPSPAELGEAVREGCAWLVRTQNEDGGWGDTADSPSNVSTTVLCWAALGLHEGPSPEIDRALAGAEGWLRRRAGELTPDRLTAVITDRYGEDRTFSAPILALCALTGRFGRGEEAWRSIPALPFEVAALPRPSFRLLGLPVVSYALPALIAIGQARFHHGPRPNPLVAGLRRGARARTLEVLESIQPPNGGYLEATPLTAFVTMSLVSIGLVGHRVVERAVGFLTRSRRPDGSWPIDTDLATWVTTQSLEALSAGGRLERHLDGDRLEALGRWLLDQQFGRPHAYTGAPPGGWGWTDLPGSVPDADDTAGALVALRRLTDAGAVDEADAAEAARDGVRWLLGRQNRDGGMPTFCRGWGKLPFDRSAPDLTAHALRAWDAWRDEPRVDPDGRLEAAVDRGVRFLVRAQRRDGAWIPLWFGNQAAAGQENPLYGTARVLQASGVEVGDAGLDDAWTDALDGARRWILARQNPDGGWGAQAGVASSVEETGLALAALAADRPPEGGPPGPVGAAVDRGLGWLRDRAADGVPEATPIGLYFAKLWYSEELYPTIFATAATEAWA